MDKAMGSLPRGRPPSGVSVADAAMAVAGLEDAIVIGSYYLDAARRFVSAMPGARLGYDPMRAASRDPGLARDPERLLRHLERRRKGVSIAYLHAVHAVFHLWEVAAEICSPSAILRDFPGVSLPAIGRRSDIGQAAALDLARQGAKVLITARRPEPLKEAAGDHLNIATLIADVAVPDDALRTVAKAVDT